jgi:hypothetical protein
MNDFYHEAGHTLMAYLFKDFFETEFVTLELKISKINDPKSKGGVKGKINKEVKSLSSIENDSIILMLFAGFCADEINSQTQITDNNYEPKYWAPKLSEIRYEGDIERMKNHLILLLPEINLEQVPYFSNCMKFLNTFFQKKQVWKTIELISKELSESKNLTLASEQIIKIIESSGFPNWWETNKKDFFEERMRLIKTAPNSSLKS